MEEFVDRIGYISMHRGYVIAFAIVASNFSLSGGAFSLRSCFCLVELLCVLNRIRKLLMAQNDFVDATTNINV